MSDPGGIYIHVPFCEKHCPFCDFAITTDRRRKGDWADAVCEEIALRAPSWPQRFDTAYFGGGTPSLLEPATVDRLLGALRARLDVADHAEITLEANPGDLDAGEYTALREVGVNRLSLGVQSFDDDDLRFLGRVHDASQGRRALELAREAGFDNVTVDLIYALPGRDLDHWQRQLEQIARLGPEHVTCYTLTYEPGTPLTRRRDRGEFEAAPEEQTRELFLLTVAALGEFGYEQYEVSSFARRPEHQSRHNRKYWEGAPYLGLGPSAHSYAEPRRSWNHPRLREYLAAVGERLAPVAGSEILSLESRRLERIFLGLRTRRGLDLERLANELDDDLRVRRRELIERLVVEGLARLEGPCLALTPEGLATADALAIDLAR